MISIHEIVYFDIFVSRPWVGLRWQGGPRPKILFYAIFVEGKQSYQMLFTRSKKLIVAGFISFSKSQNTYNYIAAARFTRDYLKILNFDTKNLSTVFELETSDLAVILFTSFLTTCFSRIFELGP